MGDVKDAIKTNIAIYRKKAGYTQEQLAEAIGVKKTTVSTWERGASSPDVETLYEICKLFGISLNTMYGIDDEPQTIAAHFDGDEFTEEEMEDIHSFIEFVKSRKKS